jgi:hypothetical protein
VQIEIKSQGLAAVWRALADNADVTSTAIAGGLAVLLGYGFWKLGRGIDRANTRFRSRSEARRGPALPSTTVASNRPLAADRARMLARQWGRVESYAQSTIARAGEARRSHDGVGTLLDALDFELAELIAEMAPISSYAAGRTAKALSAPSGVSARRASAIPPIAA